MTNYRAVLRPARAEDIAAFFGDGQKRTIEAIVMEAGGELLGVAGLAYERDKVTAFSDLRPAALRHRREIALAARQVAQMAARAKGPVVTAADPKYPASAQLLSRIGFERVGQIGGNEVFKWPN